MLNGGPIWWWYLNEGTYTYPQIKWTTSGSYWPNSVFGSQAGWDAFRKKHTLKFKFIDNTNWRITYIINGSEYSQTIPTYGGWTFSDKESIEVRYRMSTAYETGANPFTSPHTLTFYDPEKSHKRVSLRNWNIVGPSSTGVSFYNMFYECHKFNGDLSNWTITDPENMANMLRCGNREITGSFISSLSLIHI